MDSEVERDGFEFPKRLQVEDEGEVILPVAHAMRRARPFGLALNGDDPHHELAAEPRLGGGAETLALRVDVQANAVSLVGGEVEVGRGHG